VALKRRGNTKVPEGGRGLQLASDALRIGIVVPVFGTVVLVVAQLEKRWTCVASRGMRWSQSLPSLIVPTFPDHFPTVSQVLPDSVGYATSE
jgi:hypothetical protein